MSAITTSGTPPSASVVGSVSASSGVVAVSRQVPAPDPPQAPLQEAVQAVSFEGDFEQGAAVNEESVEKLRSALHELADSIAPNAQLIIRRDAEADRFVYEFRDVNTGEVMRQFPAEDVLRAIKAQRTTSAGFVVDARV